MKKHVAALLMILCAAFLLFGSGVQTAKAEAVYLDEYITAPEGKLSAGELIVYENNKETLKLTGATAVKWQSNCEEIAVVSKKGVVTGVKEGICRVACTDEAGKVYSCEVEVRKPCINKAKSQMLMASGHTVDLKLLGAKAVSWKSDNKAVATVSQKGKVLAQSVSWSQYNAGKTVAVITCKDKNGNEYSCRVTVFPKDYISHFGSSDHKSVADIKKVLGKNEINKVYVKGEKAYIYYATNGAFGELGNVNDMLRSALQLKYPQCDTSYDMQCVFQYCDGIDANNWADYSLYYEELTVIEHDENEKLLHEIDVSVGDTYYNYFYPEELEKAVEINRKNFGELYETLLTFDLNADGVLCEGELERIWVLKVEKPISSVKGLDKLTKMTTLDLTGYSGKKIDVSGAKALTRLYITCNTTELTVVGPQLDYVYLASYYYITDDGMDCRKVKKIDVSSCLKATELCLQPANTQVAYKLPGKSDKLEILNIGCVNSSSLNFSAYKNLRTLSVTYSPSVSKLDLSKNKLLESLRVYQCKNLKKSNISIAKGINPELNLY